MKSKYVTALMMLFAITSTPLNSYDHKTLTFKNSTTKTLKVFIKSKYKNTSNETRHDEKTMTLAPATTVCQKNIPANNVAQNGHRIGGDDATPGYPTIYGQTGTDSFTYTVNSGHDSQIEVFTIYDNTNPTVALNTNITTNNLEHANTIILIQSGNGKIHTGGDTAADCGA